MTSITWLTEWMQALKHRGTDRHDNGDPLPYRAELFSVDQMAQHGRILASTHVLSTTGPPTRLLKRLKENEQILISSCDLLTDSVKARQRIVPSGEWLLDNFYLIEEQIRTARQHLPKNYSRELPRIEVEPSFSLPRVYALALEAIAHGDGHVDPDTLSRFIDAYQTVTTLTLGELWAIPIMLRLALIENLRRLAAHIATDRQHLNQAQDWANQMMTVAETDPKSLILVIADMARSSPPLVSPFVAELARRLQGHGPGLALPLTWIEQRLEEVGLTIDQMVQMETQQQAADQVSVSNSINSLRLLGAIDWRLFVESHSVVERLLRQDPGNHYVNMDFATRDRYRHVIDRLAKRHHLSESAVAAAAIELTHHAQTTMGGKIGEKEADAAGAPNNNAPADYRLHVGFYLIDQGLGQLKAALNIRHQGLEWLRTALSVVRLELYLGAILLLSLALTTAFLQHAQALMLDSWRLILFGIIAFFATSQLASTLVNWATTLLIAPKRLPRMDFSQGIPPSMRSLVVVPAMLSSAGGVADLLEALEVRALGNQDDNLHFGLLTDFIDAAKETLPEDSALLRQACAGIKALNSQYPGAGSDRFFLFHRPRRWNAAEGVWMGYERKRGKLAQLTQALRGGGWEDFSCIVGAVSVLRQVKYVITLDTDTLLPREVAREFVATMAHPLNRPRYDRDEKRLLGGYGLLQPRMAASLHGAMESRYSKLFGSEPGIDPYTRSVSDVYQDLFGEGSYIGKGIYDVDAFQRTLQGRFPENRILSHDLLEGCYARSGLLSDVHLYEQYPSRYDVDLCRQERWIRGDWQIASWLLPRVPVASGPAQRNPLSALSRWKILDNLRRSLVPAATMLLLLVGWFSGTHPLLWTLVVLGIYWIPPLLIALVDMFRKPRQMRLGQHLASVIHSAATNIGQAGFRIACLPHEASFNLAAILRSCGRMLITHRRCLVWNLADEQTSRIDNPVIAMLQLMWAAPVISLSATIGLFWLQPQALASAVPVLLVWLMAPAIAAWLSQPLLPRNAELTHEQAAFLRRMARKTWNFFEQFVVAETHWLPPDNFQEQPGPVVAYRTSPTDMGLALLANLSAYDFGFISVGALISRTADAFQSMAALQRHQGHFYNWYDIKSLQTLSPRYISSVDSGNLAGHLLTLRAGLLSLPDQPIVSAGLFEGLSDTLEILILATPDLQSALADSAVSVTGLASDAPSDNDTRQLIVDLQRQLKAACSNPPRTLCAIWTCLESIVSGATNLTAAPLAATETELAHWAAAFERQCRDFQDELRVLAPWLMLPTANGGRGAMVGLTGLPDSVTLPSLRRLVEHNTLVLKTIDARMGQSGPLPNPPQLVELRHQLQMATEVAATRIATSKRLAQQASDFATMDYAFLYDRNRHLLAIGYNVDDYRCDTSYYDLLASEARLSSFVGIAQGQLPQESWFALGRLQTTAGGAPVLVSWSGSMFEYLMPMLVMPTYAGTLLDRTCHAAVARQIHYGSQRSLPWGVSESGYNTFDASLNYQYHAFGVPGLGLKRGLAEDKVVTPYASALALMVAPEAACANLQLLATAGLEGRFGFYEAIDYTPSRLARGQNSVIVRSFMAHHQGMILLSLGYLMLDHPMQRRFESDPQFQATLLLLQERVPKAAIFHNRVAEDAEGRALFDTPVTSAQAPMGPDTPTPEVQLLSNGRYHLMVTNAGGGYSRWRDLAVSRWRADSTRDHWGMFIYLRDRDSGAFWSAGHQPTTKTTDHYAATFSEGRAEFRRRDEGIETYSEIVVSPEDDIELRRVKVTNRSSNHRILDITSYAEVVLATQAADMMQPSFGNLFVQTEILRNRQAILCSRRPRSEGEETPWMFHLLVANQGSDIGELSFETDRMRFIGRGRSLTAPLALSDNAALSGSAGSVLDPIVAIRCVVRLKAEQSVAVDLVSGVAESREACMALIEKYQDPLLAGRVFDLAFTHGGVTLRQINASEADSVLYRRLAGAVLYANNALRADAAVLTQNRRGQSGLWGYAISGDLPIVLLKIGSTAHIELARQMIQCHAYWRLKGLAVDLVIWNEDHASYRQRLQDAIMGLIATGSEAHAIDRPGGIFVRYAEQIPNEDRILLQSVACAIISDRHGTLEDQVNRRGFVERRVARFKPTRRYRQDAVPAQSRPAPDLMLTSPMGGFSADGREYVITTTATRRTPMPWVNVLANPDFGSVITESGLAYTWRENAHEFRLTPWSGDAVGTSGGEAIYLRDEETGHYWSPTPWPCGDSITYRCRHGFGYSVFEHVEDGLDCELWIYVDRQASVKFSVLKLNNMSGRTRHLTVTGYVEWVLGDLRPKTAPYLITEIDAGSGALFVHNTYNTEFAGRVAFFDVDDPARTLSGDRRAFLGRNGTPECPDAMFRPRISGHVGAALDPCAALQVPVELGAGQQREIIFRLGASANIDEARQMALALRQRATAQKALAQVREYWHHTLGAVQVDTPDPAVNVLANGWLVYQTLASRLWARSGFYQSGGAYGFRDQLQDVMALVHAEPALVREHLLRCAQRQYPEGDVQHWWHPPSGRGVRTRCSDDYLWLALVTCRYVQTTGDRRVLDEKGHFLAGRLLTPDEESYYDQPGVAPDDASLYQHCVRGILHGLQFGQHGLPLMGSGDWNDGMNLVGIEGRGESVWLGFFLYQVLIAFAGIATLQNDETFANRCRQEAATLRRNLERHAWDGEWYLRAWFDDGMALGTADSPECAIDAIAQSWAVLSGASEPARARKAMDALDHRLVRRDHGLIQLLDPPFDASALNPGYIKGYVPGVRENGGQYTHAAVWSAMAFAELGDSRRAWELLGLINPVNHALDAQALETYKVEPYVVAADIYAVAPHIGRGGWTWYTGSAGWLYRLIVESLLGLRREADHLHVNPCMPADWTTYSLSYRYGETWYRITVDQRLGTLPAKPRLILDGVDQGASGIPLVDDRHEHQVKVTLNQEATAMPPV